MWPAGVATGPREHQEPVLVITRAGFCFRTAGVLVAQCRRTVWRTQSHRLDQRSHQRTYSCSSRRCRRPRLLSMRRSGLQRFRSQLRTQPATANLRLHQPMRPPKPSTEIKSGRAAGSGTGDVSKPICAVIELPTPQVTPLPNSSAIVFASKLSLDS
jgi:hypothetical protein